MESRKTPWMQQFQCQENHLGDLKDQKAVSYTDEKGQQLLSTGI